MSHFAHVINGIVDKVIVADQTYIDNLAPTPGTWIQTSYNTQAGVNSTGGTALRKNFAGPGYTYDATRDAFIPPRPFPSWQLNETTCLWNPPTPAPSDNHIYQWNEATTSWIKNNKD